MLQDRRSGAPPAGGLEVHDVVRQRIRSLRQSRGWSLDELAARTQLGPSTLSRIETGRRQLSLEQLVPIARALGTTIDTLVDTSPPDDVVIRPVRDEAHGRTVWPLTRPGTSPTVTKLRLTPSPETPTLRVHPGRDWFYVVSGTVMLLLGDQQLLVRTGEAAEFETMTPHAFAAHRRPAEMISIFDLDGQQSHLHSP